MSRLATFEFTVTREGEVRSLTFYATTEPKARALAVAWAAKHGWTLEERKA